MDELLSYLIEYLFASLVLYAGYLCLRKFLAPEGRRIILMAGVILPLLVPLFHVTTFSWWPEKTEAPVKQLTVKPVPDEGTTSLTGSGEVYELPVNPSEKHPVPATADWKSLGIGLYALVTSLLLLRLLVGLWTVIRLARRSETMQLGGRRVFLVKDATFSGASFFRWLFLDSALREMDERNVILDHEQVHGKKWHSLDTLLNEMHSVFCWFNPVAWFLRRESAINAEMEADYLISEASGTPVYLHHLVALSVTGQLRILSQFSKISLKRRITALEHRIKTNWRGALPLMALFLSLAVIPVACSDPLEDQARKLAGVSLNNVRKITTTYISHQQDTQEKDDQIVSVVFLNRDQTVERMYHLTSYPYTSNVPKNQEFLSSPDTEGLLAIMDGLSLEYAERNLLYGNDWPKLIARAASNGKNPDVSAVHNNLQIEYHDNQLPAKISSVWKSKDLSMQSETTQLFTYDDKKITRYSEGQMLPMGGYAANMSKNMTLKIHDEVEFHYEGNHLVRMTSGKKSWTFVYDGAEMVESSFFINDICYNRRKYYYNDKGLKLRTEIFNTYEEAEYTIMYEYDFHDLAED